MRRDQSAVRWLAGALLAGLAAMGWSTTASAQEGASSARHVVATLVAKSRNAVPGRPLQLALRQQIATGWHTYWVNPGDSGLPTTVDWTLPEGFKADPIVWSTPVRFNYGPVVGYGYQTEVLLPITVHVPETAASGTEITLSAHASWLVCSDVCEPEDARLTITLPVGTQLEADPTWVQAFAETAARTPRPNPFPVTATLAGGAVVVHLATGDATGLRDVAFFPLNADVIRNDAPQAVVADAGGLTLTLQRDTAGPTPTAINGVLAFRDLGAGRSDVTTSLLVASPILPAALPTSLLEFAAAFVLAILGGLILNLMPCVLPVLSIKLFGLVQHAHEGPRHARLQGIAYTAGVLASFAVVGAALIGLRAAGTEIGWGFQLQSPLFVAGMIYVLFLVGLNLSGVFTFDVRLAGIGSGLTMRGGTTGSFFTGALATLVATPCTAPFMAAAMGYAITQPWYVSFAIFEAVGFGLALPYLIVAFSPATQRWLPKPGAWMVRLKEFLAFPIYGTIVWLLYVLSQQIDPAGLAATLAGLVLLAFGVWLVEVFRSAERSVLTLRIGLPTLSFLAAVVLVATLVRDAPPMGSSSAGARVAWEPFSEERLKGLRTEGRAVFVDFTAAWCITCKVNERIALASPSVLKAIEEGNIALLRGDWTRRDPEIARVLAQHGRAGVPLYLFYPGSGKAASSRATPVVLPQLLTADSVLTVLRGG